MCVLNAMHCDSDGHDKATLAAHAGAAQLARPSHGSWVSYGLETANRNLPSFMVLAPAAPYSGAQTWGSNFLPACHQGTHVIPGGEPHLNLRPQVPSADLQPTELDLLGKLSASAARLSVEHVHADSRHDSYTDSKNSLR